MKTCNLCRIKRIVKMTVIKHVVHWSTNGFAAEDRGDFEKAELERGAPPSPPALRIRFVYEDLGGFRQITSRSSIGGVTVMRRPEWDKIPGVIFFSFFLFAFFFIFGALIFLGIVAISGLYGLSYLVYVHTSFLALTRLLG
ncbi:hypothetical protein EV426DRAFT_594292 [Tirmania nivea]|nr:hypothetical protein EV426DRAFT_594292 [Tirmania nivea]